MPEYELFWEKMSSYYPVSKGTVRLPIATDLIELEDFDSAAFLQELGSLLQDIVKNHGDSQSARARATTAGEEKIIPLITDELTGVVRFDCVMDATTNQLKIVEINCDYPDGVLLHDKTYSVLSNQEQKIHEEHYLKLFDDYDDTYVLHARDATFLDAYQTEADTLKKRGRTALGSDLQTATTYRTIKRSLEVSKLKDEDIVVLRTNNNRYINSFGLRTLGYKDLLSEINHPLVPDTFTISEKSLARVISDKESLVIKPLNGCEGEGVYFGRDLTENAWRELATSVSDGDYVAQELVEIKKMPISFYDDGEIKHSELYFDVCPHFFIKHGEVIGAGHILMRFSESKVVNIFQGGGIGYHKL